MKYIKKFEDNIKIEHTIEFLDKMLKENPLYKEGYDFYIFIANEEFKAAGKGMYTKTLEIENMVKITPDANSVMAFKMMPLRARMQGSKLYHVWLPKDFAPQVEGKGSNLDPWMVELIDKYKITSDSPKINSKEYIRNLLDEITSREEDTDTYNL